MRTCRFSLMHDSKWRCYFKRMPTETLSEAGFFIKGTASCKKVNEHIRRCTSCRTVNKRHHQYNDYSAKERADIGPET